MTSSDNNRPDDLCAVTQASRKKPGPVPLLSGESEARFWAHVEKSDGCWNWTGPTSGNRTHKYGDMTVNYKSYRAHRLSFVLAGRLLPAGSVIDHLCRNTLCVNPAHLEPVTSAENTRRGLSYPTHCAKGHLLSGANAKPRGHGMQRACRQCGTERMQRFRARQQEASHA